MTSERAKAYGRVMQILRDVGEAKLSPAEQQRVRENADALFFSEDVGADASAREAVSDITSLASTLVDAERWSEDRARDLVSDVLACGPVATVG
jgi:hypothetical protein